MSTFPTRHLDHAVKRPIIEGLMGHMGLDSHLDMIKASEKQDTQIGSLAMTTFTRFSSQPRTCIGRTASMREMSQRAIVAELTW